MIRGRGNTGVHDEARGRRRWGDESMIAFFCSQNFWSWPAWSSSLQIQLSVRGPSSGTSWSPVEKQKEHKWWERGSKSEISNTSESSFHTHHTHHRGGGNSPGTIWLVSSLHWRWKIRSYITFDIVWNIWCRSLTCFGKCYIKFDNKYYDINLLLVVLYIFSCIFIYTLRATVTKDMTQSTLRRRMMS